MDTRIVQGDCRSVFSAQLGALLELVEEFTLHAPFAHRLACVRIESLQDVGVVACDFGQIADGKVRKRCIAVATKRHVVNPLGRKYHAQTLLRICSIDEECLSGTVDVVVVGRRVVYLVGVFRNQVEVRIADVDSTSTCCHVVGQVVDRIVLLLVLAYETTADSETELAFVERLNHLVELDFTVNATKDTIGKFPVVALLANQPLDVYTRHNRVFHTRTENRIVDTERLFLVRTQGKTVAELLVEMSYCDLELVVGKVSPIRRNTKAIVLAARIRETEQGVVVTFETHASRKFSVRNHKVGIRVRQQSFINGYCANLLVFKIILQIALEITRDIKLVLVLAVLLCKKLNCRQKGNKQK